MCLALDRWGELDEARTVLRAALPVAVLTSASGRAPALVGSAEVPVRAPIWPAAEVGMTVSRERGGTHGASATVNSDRSTALSPA
jgi:hypothetical protein